MKRKNMARNALFTSIISLLLCVSMLVGTTFAWFTDSVESGLNTITAGNLDIELDYYTGSGWDSVKDTTNLFSSSLWEPGHAEVVYLKLSNEGTMALDYSLAIKVESETEGTNVAGQQFKLSDYIYFGVTEVDKAGAFETRADAIAAINPAPINKGYVAGGSMTATAVDKILALVVYMPETVENEANYRGNAVPEITLGINLSATQKVQESDGFDNTYDENAGNGSSPATPDNVTTNTQPITEDVVDENNALKNDVVLTDTNKTVKTNLPEGTKLEAEAGEIKVIITKDSSVESGVSVGTDESALSYNIEIPAVSEDNTKVISVTLNIGAGKTGVKVYHKGEAMTAADTQADGTFTYNAQTGDLTVYSRNYSPFDIVFDKANTVNTEDELRAALANGGDIKLGKDIAINADNTITIAAGKSAKLDLDGYTLSGVAEGTGNREMFLVKGNLTVKNGTMKMSVTQNQGWNAMITIFDVTAGGKLTLDKVNASVGGSDMNFVVHLNNWGTASAEITNCDFNLSYVAVRAFNSGNDLNTVTIKNTNVTGGARLFWVHNYTAEGKDDTTLKLDIYNNGNTSNNAKPVRFGFDDEIYFDMNGTQLVTATTLDEVMAAAKNGNVIIDAQGANLGDFNYDGTFGNGTVLKNAKFTYVYGASVDGVATFENCEFVSDHSYSANFSDGTYTGKVIFNNCLFDGWSSFGTAITGVEMNNCTFQKSYNFGILRFYQDAELNNCTFADSFEGVDTNQSGTVVKINDCTGVEGKIYNNGAVVGTWIVDGVDISSTVASW